MVTYQAHRAITKSGDLWSILTELRGRQLGVTGDLANDFLNLVHGVCCLKVGQAIVWRLWLLLSWEEE